MKSIYLDVCSLCRPFDDQTYLRIRMETEAVSLILTKVREGRCKMYVSPVHFKEIDAITESEERLELKVVFLIRRLRRLRRLLGENDGSENIQDNWLCHRGS